MKEGLKIKTDRNTISLAYAYYRLSKDEANKNESESIANQKMLVRDYCEKHDIVILREFVDDGFSGGNFQRPAFKEMLTAFEAGKANTILTKDLSRLGRDMRESSYYAEEYFPQRQIRYITTHDSFDGDNNDPMIPFKFAMNESYLRDGSRKVRQVLKSKREHGLYCACPPYGYKKAQGNKAKLVPDENTAPMVRQIFEKAAAGDSSRKIALDLTQSKIIPPLKYRVLYRDDFSEEGAARVTDTWSYTTVKRILKNQVYLGHTLLGKKRKISLKSKKQITLPKDQWSITYNTHEPLVSTELFNKAALCLGKDTRDFRQHEQVRRSIFSGIAYCALCGHAMCSAGSVYKGEREKYWYLSCTHKRKGVSAPCSGARIRYVDLLELVRQDLNGLIQMTSTEKEQLVREIKTQLQSEASQRDTQLQLDKSQARMEAINRILMKLYNDFAEGKLDESRLDSMVKELNSETDSLRKKLQALTDQMASTHKLEQDYAEFFTLIDRYTSLESLDREALLTFVDRIEVGKKILPDGCIKNTHNNMPFRQEVKIFYKFIGRLSSEDEISMPIADVS